MPRGHWANEVVFFCLLVCNVAVAIAQRSQIELTVTDENGVAVSGAQVVVSEPGILPQRLTTDYAGRCEYSVHGNAPYEVDVEKPGFYQTLAHEVDPHQQAIELVLAHQQMVREQVNVVASTPGIDPDQTSDVNNMSTPEIVSIPYQPSRDIRNLLPFNPGVVQDEYRAGPCRGIADLRHFGSIGWL